MPENRPKGSSHSQGSPLRRIKVTFTSQQLQVLEKLREEGTFGANYPDIIMMLFRRYVRQTIGRRGP